MAETTEPTAYMERTRLYYRALGYQADYVWANFDTTPLAKLNKPVSESRVALVTTASPAGLTNRDEDGRKRVWAARTSSPPDDMVTDNVAWDKETTHTRDRESYLPIAALNRLADEGEIAGLTEHFVGVPTEYSQAKTLELDAPDVLHRVRRDRADLIVLCPL